MNARRNIDFNAVKIQCTFSVSFFTPFVTLHAVTLHDNSCKSFLIFPLTYIYSIFTSNILEGNNPNERRDLPFQVFYKLAGWLEKVTQTFGN